MQLLPLEKLRPREVEGQSGEVEFGLFLPWISAVPGNRLYLKIIHAQVQFRPQIRLCEFELSHRLDSVYGYYWSVAVDIPDCPPSHLISAWGLPGLYVYRHKLANPLAATPTSSRETTISITATGAINLHDCYSTPGEGTNPSAWWSSTSPIKTILTPSPSPSPAITWKNFTASTT